MERLVHNELFKHFTKHNLLPQNQSRFRPNDSTTNQLARIVHRLAKAIDEGKFILTCYYDLSKAFDTVWHKGLLHKLHHMGVDGAALAWLTSYLQDRRQKVRINSATSEWAHVPAGVPQGSVLEPLLFLAYTSDLPESVTCPDTVCDQFADDTALTTCSTSALSAVTGLQASVNTTATWLQQWRLRINPKKTAIMETSRRIHRNAAQLSLHGTQLDNVNTHRHLGVVLSSDLRWTAHVETSILAKVTPLLGVLKRLSSSLVQPPFVLSTRCTCVRDLNTLALFGRTSLDISGTVWSGCNAKQPKLSCAESSTVPVIMTKSFALQAWRASQLEGN